MKKLICFTKKEWVRYQAEKRETALINTRGAYKAGLDQGRKDVDILVSALAVALKAQRTDTASIDISDPYFVGKHAYGILRSGTQLTVHIYPKELLPDG
jgi:hypothetical protein